MGKSCLLQLLPKMNKCRGTDILLGLGMPEPPTATSTALRYPQGNAERATELHFQPGQHWCSRAPRPHTMGTNCGNVLSWHNYQDLKIITFTHSTLTSLLVRLYTTKNCWSSSLCPADAGDDPYTDAEMGWQCWELETRAAGLKGNSQGTPPPARRRDGFVPSMNSGKLSDQANTGAGRQKPPVSCRLPQFADGKAAWPCWGPSLRGTFFRLNTDPNQSAGQANPSLLHPSHMEQPLEKSLSEKGVI